MGQGDSKGMKLVPLKDWNTDMVVYYFGRECTAEMVQYQDIIRSQKIQGKTLKEDPDFLNIAKLKQRLQINSYGHRCRIVEAVRKARTKGEYEFPSNFKKVAQGEQPSGSLFSSVAGFHSDYTEGNISEQDVVDWTTTQVETWIEKVSNDEGFKKVILNSFGKNHIDGLSITLMDPQNEMEIDQFDEFLMKELNIHNCAYRSQIAFLFKKILKERTYQPPGDRAPSTASVRVSTMNNATKLEKDPVSDTVIIKIKKKQRAHRKLGFKENTEDELRTILRPLFDTEEYKNKLLPTTWDSAVQLHKLAEKKPETSYGSLTQSLGSLPASYSPSTTTSSYSPGSPFHKSRAVTLKSTMAADMADMTIEDDNEIDKGEEVYIPDFLLEQVIPIRLVFSETLPEGAMQKGLKPFLSPLMTAFKLSSEPASVHVGVAVGPWYLEWNSTELVIARVPTSNVAFTFADIPPVAQIEGSYEDVRAKLAELAVEWNTTKSYKLDGNKKYYLNSQDFVDALFEKLGAKLPDETSSIGEYMKAMREKGVLPMEITFKTDVATELKLPNNRFGLNGLKATFTTHRELDGLLNHIFSVEPSFAEKYPLEHALLMSFDRNFWLRHVRNDKEKKYQPDNCPYKDPRIAMNKGQL